MTLGPLINLFFMSYRDFRSLYNLFLCSLFYLFSGSFIKLFLGPLINLKGAVYFKRSYGGSLTKLWRGVDRYISIEPIKPDSNISRWRLSAKSLVNLR